MQAKFTSIQFSLMVGIGGGVPSDDADIRLGDVVVSQPYKQHGGVVQYDFGKNWARWIHTDGFFKHTASYPAKHTRRSTSESLQTQN
jgi:nucleoside phosphorylase